MKKAVTIILAALSLMACSNKPEYALKVNTLIGNGGEGLESTFLYPGATYPFGMVQFTPTFKEPNIGFTGFQLSGVGCYSLGQFPVLPQAGAIETSPCHMFNWKENIKDKKGHAGYFECTVDEKIHTEMSVTPRTGMAVMTPSEDCGQISMALGVGFEISNGEFGKGEGRLNADGSFEGHAVAHDFCSAADTPFDIYYYAEFDRKPITSGAWLEDNLMPGETAIEGRESGLYCVFDGNKPLKYKFAMSFVSIENAKENLKAENPGWNFDKVRKGAEKAWNDYLSKVEVKGGSPEREEQFYTHLYHSLIHPSLCNDVNGDYMGSDFKVHKVEEGHKAYHMFSNWDTYRSQIQMVSLLAPDVASDVVRSHLNFAEQCGGGMPRWAMANYETNVMQGDPGALICCNAYAFGAKDFDVNRVAKVLYRAAEDSTLMTQAFPARPDLGDYLTYGRCHPSMTLEYCCADFGISQFALEACHDTLKANEYLRRSGNWKNVFNYETKWIQGRNHDGSYRGWHEAWNEFQEASHVIYHWMVPQDLNGLCDATGGKEASEERLDFLFEKLDDLYDGEHFAACNEPSFAIPWTYNWVGRPDKSSQVVHRILTEVYSTGMDGVPGNDDLGAMGSWYTFACLGMYPVIPGYGGFALNTPVFEDITIHLEGGDVRIKGGSDDFAYIKTMTVDGAPWSEAWLPYDMIKDGAEIVYTTTPELGESNFGTTVLPPSFSSAF